MNLEQIISIFPEEEFLKADGFDEAIVGVCPNTFRLAYSITKCIDILERDMSTEEAYEHFDFNVLNAYVGEKPLFGYAYNFFIKIYCILNNIVYICV